MAQTPPSALVGMTPYLLFRLGRSARRDLGQRVRHDLGISLDELRVLAAVDEGEADEREIGPRIGLDRADVTAAVDDLAHRRLVERVGKHRVAQTKAGRRALSRASLAAQTVTTSVLGALDPQERTTLHGLLARAYAAHDDDHATT